MYIKNRIFIMNSLDMKSEFQSEMNLETIEMEEIIARTSLIEIGLKCNQFYYNTASNSMEKAKDVKNSKHIKKNPWWSDRAQMLLDEKDALRSLRSKDECILQRIKILKKQLEGIKNNWEKRGIRGILTKHNKKSKQERINFWRDLITSNVYLTTMKLQSYPFGFATFNDFSEPTLTRYSDTYIDINNEIAPLSSVSVPLTDENSQKLISDWPQALIKPSYRPTPVINSELLSNTRIRNGIISVPNRTKMKRNQMLNKTYQDIQEELNNKSFETAICLEHMIQKSLETKNNNNNNKIFFNNVNLDLNHNN
jgi:hypothetical protein